MPCIVVATTVDDSLNHGGIHVRDNHLIHSQRTSRHIYLVISIEPLSFRIIVQ